MTEPLIERLPGPVTFLDPARIGEIVRNMGLELGNLDEKETRRLLGRWVSEEEPVLVRIGIGALIGLARAGEDHLDPLPIYVRVSMEYQLDRAAITDKMEWDHE